MPIGLPLHPPVAMVDLYRLFRGGGITVSSPETDPLISTTIQPDGDILNRICRDRLSRALADGTDLGALLNGHMRQVRERVAALGRVGAAARPLGFSGAVLPPFALWAWWWWEQGFPLDRLWQILLPAVVAPILRFAPFLPRHLALRLALRHYRAERGRIHERGASGPASA